MSFSESYFRSGNYSNFKSGPTGKYFWSRRFYAKLVLRERNRGRLLEVGCGLGHLLRRFESHFETYGMDVSEFALEQTRKVAPRAKLRQLPAERVDEFGAAFFDVVVGIHVIEHLPDPEDFLQKLRFVLRPEGMFFMVTPNLSAPLREWKGQNWHGFRDPTHISLKHAGEWMALLQRNGFVVRRAFGDGMWDVPYVKHVPNLLQTAFFSLPAAVQALTARPMLPVKLSESLICVAVRS